MRIPNLAHGGFFMLGAYFGATITYFGGNFWLAVLGAGLGVGVIGILFERLHPAPARRQRAGPGAGHARRLVHHRRPLPADLDRRPVTAAGAGRAAPAAAHSRASRSRPTGSWCSVIALVTAVGLYFLMERTRLGAMIRAGVDDMEMARGVGIPVSRLFTIVFCLGAALAGLGGVLGGPILNAYPGLDADMLPLALIVVILGGAGCLLGAFVGSFVVGFLYNFGIALFPDLAYFILFLPMVLVLVFLPQGLFGRVAVMTRDATRARHRGRRAARGAARHRATSSTSTSRARS